MYPTVLLAIHIMRSKSAMDASANRKFTRTIISAMRSAALRRLRQILTPVHLEDCSQRELVRRSLAKELRV